MKDLTIAERTLYQVFSNAYFMGTEDFRNEMYTHVADMWVAFTDKVRCANKRCAECKDTIPCDVYYKLVKDMQYINEHEASLAGLAIDQMDNNN